MNKQDVIRALAQKTGFTQAKSEKMINSLLEIITEALAFDEKVQFSGFGSFETTVRAPRIGRNNKTNEMITIPAVRSPVFRASDTLKAAVNNDRVEVNHGI